MKLYSATTNRTNSKFNGCFTSVYTNENGYSIFNILGPLTNPAGAPNQLLGVFHIDLCGILSRVLKQLGSKHVLVVCGEGGLNKITLTGKTRVAELKDKEIRE